MPYSAQISRTNPACILLLIDQSKSMEDPFIGQEDQKKSTGRGGRGEPVAAEHRAPLREGGRRPRLLPRRRHRLRSKTQGRPRRKNLPHDVLMPISKLGDKPLRIENRKKTVRRLGIPVRETVKFPVWFDEEANGSTPMCEAFAAA